jgi:hypothetical protein
MKAIKNKSVYLFSTVFGLIMACFSACDSNDRCATEYYPAEGDGYVVNGTTKQPVPYAKVVVTAYLEQSPITIWGEPCCTTEVFAADSVGYFRVRFLKRTECKEIIELRVSASSEVGGEKRVGRYDKIKDGSLIEKVQSAKETVHVGTIKLCWDYLHPCD